MTDSPKVHPLRRRKTRRGKRKKRAVVELAIAPVPPQSISNLRSRLSLMTKRGTNG